MIPSLRYGALALGLCGAGAVSAASPASAFYAWSTPVPQEAGIVLRHEILPADLLPSQAASGERILYSSVDGMDDHTPVAVSGMILIPKGKMPSGGWPIMAWAHGTVGVADVCAPSWRGSSADRNRYLDTWLENGFAVVASDYQGLGTAGVHPYLLYKPEAYSVLDNVRAALNGWALQLANQIIIVGQSQGGGGALGAAYLAPSYAPDLNTLGVVATGAVAQFRVPDSVPQLAVPAGDENGGGIAAAYEALFLLGTVQAMQPDLAVDSYVAATALPVMKAARDGCFHDAIDTAEASAVTLANFYGRPIDALNQQFDAQATFPDARFQMPVFMGTGLKDTAVAPVRQYNNLVAMCAAGSTVDWHYYAGEDHLSTVNASTADSIPFARALLARQPVANGCATLTAPPAE